MNSLAASWKHPRDRDVPPRRPRHLRSTRATARQWLARGLLLAAMVLAVQALWLPAKAALAQVLLDTAWRQNLADGGSRRPWPWADTHPVARLAFEREGISQVVLAGDSGRTLAFGPGWAESSAAPGSAGTTVLSGHRDSHFRWLQSLRDGDEVVLETRSGQRRYAVVARRVADSRTEQLAVPANTDQLLLVTCWPFDASAPRGPLRYLVTLVPAATSARMRRMTSA